MMAKLSPSLKEYNKYAVDYVKRRPEDAAEYIMFLERTVKRLERLLHKPKGGADAKA